MSTLLSRAALRHASLQTAARSSSRSSPSLVSVRYASSGAPRRRGGRLIGLFAIGAVSAAAVYSYPLLVNNETKKPEPIIPQAEIEFEKKRKTPVSKEDNRDLISSQHIQVKQSWENPGLYAWGSNTGKVVAPESNETIVKTPRRIPYFDGQILRDVKLDREFGAAVTENGDLVQWGTGFSSTTPTPTVTLKGKDITKLAISRDRILALSSGGSVYSIPVSQKDQETGVKEDQSSWIPFWSGPAPISYRTISPKGLGMGERVIDVRSGLEHALLLTSKGRVFAAASSSQDFPSKGQLGIPGLTWSTRPKGPYDQPYEIDALKGFRIKMIAAGDYHSLALDDQGRVFSFGDNSTGQLGFSTQVDTPAIDTPSLLPFTKLYQGTSLVPKVTSIAAGGANSYFTVDATKVASQGVSDQVAPARDLGKVVADTWACGEGIYGSLGTGKWTHISSAPTKIASLSNLFEWDEKNNKVIPIRLSHLSVGSTHAAAVMDNVTNLAASSKTSEHDTNWGADIVWWGGNEHYQLGTGKRNNVNTPTYIGPLDGGVADAQKGRRGEAHRFQITPRTTVQLGESGKGRKVSIEQRVECGRFVTAVYSGA